MSINIAKSMTLIICLSAAGCLADVADPEGTQAEDMSGEEIAVAESELPGTEVILQTFTPFYIPPWVGGDRDYDGHGPEVTTHVELHLFNGEVLWASITMSATETESDWTKAEGKLWYPLYTADRNIASINGPSSFDHAYTDENHENDIIPFTAEHLVQTLEYVGDTKGEEAGTKTGVQVYFNPISITLTDP